MSAKHFLLFAATAASLPFLASCGSKTPTGQVVATVNGEEVTMGELNQEAQMQGANANDPKVRQQLLQRVIERKLLAKSAADAKMDRDPEYLLARKRAEEMMLAQGYIRKVLAKNEQPNSAALNKFMQSKPYTFDQRIIFSVDQITFGRVEDQALQRRLIAAKTIDELDGILAAAGIPRERQNANWDSAVMPPAAVQRLRSLPPGEPFIQPSNPMIAGVITGIKPSPLPPQARQVVATRGIQQEQAEKAVQSWLEGLRRSAKIEYQPGFAPPPAGAKGQPAAPTGEKKI